MGEAEAHGSIRFAHTLQCTASRCLLICTKAKRLGETTRFRRRPITWLVTPQCMHATPPPSPLGHTLHYLRLVRLLVAHRRYGAGSFNAATSNSSISGDG